MPSTSVTRPPIPQAPLVDPRTGMVTREWWRWFAAVGTASVATTASITNITNDITNIIEEAQPIPLLDDPSDPADVMRQALLLRNPGECACDLDDAAKRALRFIPPADAIGPQLDDLLRKVLELVRPIDQVATDQLMQALDRPGDQLPLDQLAIAAQLLQVPADPVPTDQLMLMAAMLAPRDGLPGYVQGSILAGAAGGWFATRTISKSPTGYPGAGVALAGKYSAFDTTGNTLEIANDDQHAPRILLTAFDNTGGTGVFPTFNVRYARGTAAAPTAVQSGDILCTLFAAAGYGATDFAGTSARFRALALQNFSDTVAGAEIRAQCTAVGTIGGTTTDVADFKASGCWLLGTNTNDNKAAGQVGEYVSSEVANTTVSLSTGVSANLTSISLTAGDWDVWGYLALAPAATTTITVMKACISITSATLNGVPNTGGALVNLPVSNNVGNNVALPCGQMRLSLAGTTTVYLVGNVTFGTSTLTGGGGVFARRV